jgi:hypothetical protein
VSLTLQAAVDENKYKKHLGHCTDNLIETGARSDYVFFQNDVVE